MRAPAFVLGYHGCDRQIGEDVLSGGKPLRASNNDYDWLGTGIYFWENSSSRALAWATAAQKNPKLSASKIDNPFVVGAIIDLENCLDLLEAESIRIVASAHNRLCDACREAGVAVPENRSTAGHMTLRHLDCAVINFAHSLRDEAGSTPFDSVRAAFFEGESLYPGAGFQKQTHIQICVRSPKSIIGYFRPLDLA